MDSLKVLVGQMTSNDSVEENFNQIDKLIQQATQQPEIVFFPENSLYFRLIEGSQVPGFRLKDPIFEKLMNLAKVKNIDIHLGSIPLWEEGRLVNASILLGKDRGIQVVYRKIHLFDIELDGRKPIRESDVFSRGQKPETYQYKECWKFGSTICYDLRFSELFSSYAKEEVDFVLVPSAFLIETGRAHWEVLLRARAIESQCYVIAAAQAGHHIGISSGERFTYGNSMIINPWGEILSRGDDRSTMILEQKLDKNEIARVRRQIPMKQHRRL